LAGASGAAAEFAQDAPGLELGVGPLARAAQLGVGAVGVFLGFGFVAAFVGGDHVLAGGVVAVVALVAQRDEPGLAQGGEDVEDPGGGGVVDAAEQVAGHPQDRAVRGGDDLQVHAVNLVFDALCVSSGESLLFWVGPDLL
jgi:hypothetical protein